ncbi:Mur ligase family protein [Candidatus Haliotispira prima]|uniref:Mur ligase family protein n=1 Tax=Candidatus Haliotispira prima TaxID=3034016 RepID=A0ABY8MJC4_9SPIO|nr:Mur ligase family protein [Candidatus Haliotispira prima]
MQQLFRNKRIVVMGLGVNGGGLLSAQFCLAHGAEVLVTDLNSEEKLTDSVSALRDFAGGLVSIPPHHSEHSGKDGAGIHADASARLHFRLGSHELEDFRQAHLVIKNPGVPDHSPYLQAAQNWTTDLALFLEFYPKVPVLAVTGTKGKSSISHALHYILQQYDPTGAGIMLGGNIGRSPLAYALEEILGQNTGERKFDLDGGSPLVLEMSSWQLGDLCKVEKDRGRVFFRPHLACLSNIMNDHQDRYRHFRDYVADKFYIFHNMSRDNQGDNQERNQGELLLGTPGATSMYLGSQCWGDFAARDFAANSGSASDNLHYFATQAMLPKGLKGLYWRPATDHSLTCCVKDAETKEQVFLNSKNFPVLGRHSFQNYCIASYMAYRFLRKQGLCRQLDDFCRRNGELMRDFGGVPFRMELRGSRNVNSRSTLYYVNDTTATMPDAAASGISACLTGDNAENSHCLLIAGGTDKELDPGNLLATLHRYQQDRQRVSLFLLQGSGTKTLIQHLRRLGLPYSGAEDDRGFPSLSAAFEAAEQKARALASTPITDPVIGPVTNLGPQPEIHNFYLLLSPGYASFGMFRNEFDRGRQFNQLVEEALARECREGHDAPHHHGIH